MNEDELSLCIRLPLPEKRIFRSKATSEILTLLVNNPHNSFSVVELQDKTSHGSSSTKTSIEILEALNLIEIKREGKKKLISINRKRLKKPDDPVFEIPQDSFRDPVRKIRERLVSEVDYIAGIILFGSVARGEADRKSDIDLLVIVEDDLVKARRKSTEIASELQESQINGQRYKFHMLVEDVESAENRGKKLETIFSEGIVLHHTKKLEKLKEVIFHAKQ